MAQESKIYLDHSYLSAGKPSPTLSLSQDEISLRGSIADTVRLGLKFIDIVGASSWIQNFKFGQLYNLPRLEDIQVGRFSSSFNNVQS